MQEDIKALKREFRHFTLIELVMVAVILGMVASLAAPGYTDYVRKARASEAIARLGTIMNASKAYYQTYGRWPGKPGEEGYYADFSATEHFSYDIAKKGPNGAEFVLEAKGFDLDAMRDVVVTMSCEDVASAAIVQLQGVIVSGS